MTTEQSHIEVSGIPVEIHRKGIKNLHIGVYPPNGKVRVAAPLHLDDEAIRLAIVSRLSWIRRQRQNFERQQRQSAREMVTGESHYVFGRRYRLNVVQANNRPSVAIKNSNTLEMRVRPGYGALNRQLLLDKWYRNQLKAEIPRLVCKWEPRVGVKVAEWRVKRMKTLWGSCNPKARRIWLNLELAKKPLNCLEYILVHEMVHFHERHHNDRFLGIMDAVMPQWRTCRDELNQAPLSHENWDY